MSWTLCSSGAAIAKAGANANSTAIASTALLAEWYDEVEGFINTATRKDWTTDYSELGTYFKKILDDVISDGIAMKIINYDMSGYTSRAEAQTMLDVIRDNMIREIEVLKEEKNKDKM